MFGLSSGFLWRHDLSTSRTPGICSWLQASLEMMKDSGISGAGLSVWQGSIESRRAPRDQISTLRLGYLNWKIALIEMSPPDPADKSPGSISLTKPGICTLGSQINSSTEGLLYINTGLTLRKNYWQSEVYNFHFSIEDDEVFRCNKGLSQGRSFIAAFKFCYLSSPHSGPSGWSSFWILVTSIIIEFGNWQWRFVDRASAMCSNTLK